jgi:hypothetical protein
MQQNSYGRGCGCIRSTIALKQRASEIGEHRTCNRCKYGLTTFLSNPLSELLWELTRSSSNIIILPRTCKITPESAECSQY